MKLHYKAIGANGAPLEGLIEAKDRNQAATALRSRGFLPVKIEIETNTDIAKYFPFFNRISQGQVVFFTRQLASMLNSGLTLMQALSILKEQLQNKQMTELVNDIIENIEGGKSLSESLQLHKDAFSPIYISLVKAAEASGLLDKILSRLADTLEKQQKLRSAVRSALIYPIIVVIGMVIVMTIMMIFVIPQLTQLYRGLNIELPLTTQVVISLSDFTINYWFIVLGFWIAFFFGFVRFRRTESGKLITDSVLLKVPIFGKIIKLTILTEFSRTLGLLIGSGTLVVEALKQTSDVAGNVLYRNAILSLASAVEKGITIGNAMQVSVLFPPILVHMSRIGEETGKLDESLLKVSEYYENEVDQNVKNLTTAMEPIIMICLGIGVAFLIISVITPIYSLISEFH